MRAPAQLQPTQDSLPTARLIRLAGSLADQAPPVDVARVASLRSAIASGSYGVHPRSSPARCSISTAGPNDADADGRN
jgi:negative regulator of flagellin synthesis FlgM